MDRLAERSRGRYPVPKMIHCDRTCLLHPSDAEYVDKMQAFLFGHDTADPPLLTSPGLWGVRVGHDHVWADETKIEWTIASALGRALSYDDYYVARRQEQHPHRLQLFNFRGTRFTLCQPWEQFPTLPAGVTLRTDLRGISMPRIRAVTYFAHVAKRFGGNVAERWFTSFTYELFAHSLVAHKLAWIRPLGYSPRVWVVSDAYVEWVHSVRGIPDIPVISSGGEQIAPVNVANVIAILTAASKSTRSVARRDFATNTVMSFVLCPEGPDRPEDPLPRRARNRSQARGPDEITPVGTPQGGYRRGDAPVSRSQACAQRLRSAFRSCCNRSQGTRGTTFGLGLVTQANRTARGHAFSASRKRSLDSSRGDCGIICCSNYYYLTHVVHVVPT